MLPGTILHCGSTLKNVHMQHFLIPEGEHKKFRTVLLDACRKHFCQFWTHLPCLNANLFLYPPASATKLFPVQI